MGRTRRKHGYQTPAQRKVRAKETADAIRRGTYPDRELIRSDAVVSGIARDIMAMGDMGMPGVEFNPPVET